MGEKTMKTIRIHKHHLTEASRCPGDVQVLKLPLSSVPLSAQEQDGRLCVWESHAAADVELKTVRFLALFTGQDFEMSEEWRYLSTVPASNGLVGPVYWSELER
jgi:hypothetical protein